MALPTDSSHLTRLSFDEMVAVFTGDVESRFAYLSVANQQWPARMLRGTNAAFNRYFGKTKIIGVTPGVRPDAFSTPMTKRGVEVDTIALARNNVDLLNDVQSDFSILAEIALDQGKEHAIFYDEAHFLMLGRGARQGPLAGVDSIPGGKVETLTAAQVADADVFADKIALVLSAMRKENIPDTELTVYVGPDEFDTLIRNDKLVSRDYTTQGADYAMRKIFYINGVRIFETNGFPKVATPAGQNHVLSNTRNANVYNITADDIKARAMIGHSKSLMPAANISLTAKIWYNDEELQYFADSYLAFGVTWNRPDVCGLVAIV